MIKKIHKIKHFGVFEDFKADLALPDLLSVILYMGGIILGKRHFLD